MPGVLKAAVYAHFILTASLSLFLNKLGLKFFVVALFFNYCYFFGHTVRHVGL